MPPEQPPFLVVLDLAFDDDALTGTVQHVRPRRGDKPLYVRWGVGTPPPKYRAEGGGVVFVRGQRRKRSAVDPRPNIMATPKGYTYSEGFDGADWMMLVLVLPPGHTLTDVSPAIAGAQVDGDRTAVYWRLVREGPQVAAEVSFGLRRAADSAELWDASAPREPMPFGPTEPAPSYRFFLSYRRKDDQFAAGLIYDAMCAAFGANAVFRDVESLEAGDTYPEKIDAAVGDCAALLAVIGPYWLDPEKPDGERRVDRDDDWPSREIEFALQRHRKVVPVFLNDTAPPTAGELPASLRVLAYTQGLRVRADRLHDDLAALVRDLDAIA